MREGDWEIRKIGKDTCSVERYLGSDTELAIPERIGSYQAVEIGAKLLKKTSKVRSLSLPKSIEYIDPEAFQSWRWMEGVKAEGKKLKSRDGVLYDGAFKSLVFYPPKKEGDLYEAPDSLRRVLPGAFSATVPLRTFSFYGSFEEFSAKPSECPSLECITALESGKLSTSEGVLFKGKKLLFYPAAKRADRYSIPEGTESIEVYGEPMFPSHISALSVPASLKTGLSENAGLTGGIEVDYGCQAYASRSGVLFSKRDGKLRVYPAGKKDSFYMAPHGTTAIASGAFRGASVSSVVLPSSLVHIEGEAFASSAISNLVIPSSASDIDIRALSGMDALTAVFVEPRSIGDIFLSGSSLSGVKRYVEYI